MAVIPALPLPRPSLDQVLGAAKEVTYVAIGFGVLGFQQAQVRRREIEKALTPLLSPIADTIAAGIGCTSRAGRSTS